MKLLRPIDPTRPIVVHNAHAVELEEPPPAWLADQMGFVIETNNVEVADG
jgi:hypothetical protein